MKVTASAPGKLMLFGEHAVVYGYPCIVSAVDLRYFVSVEKDSGSQVWVETPNFRTFNQPFSAPLSEVLGQTTSPRGVAFVLAALRRFFARYSLQEGVRISTEGPGISYGLGSSSAVTVAAVSALAGLFQKPLTPSDIYSIALEAVLEVQGKGSGFDVAAAIYGGTLYFEQGGSLVEPLDLKDLPLLIGFSGSKVSTTSLVDQVAGLKARNPQLVDGIFRLIGDLVQQAKSQLQVGNWSGLGDLINLNQGLLEALGVGTLQLARQIHAAREAGALGAKLSGAGGGDCMFALVEQENRRNVSSAVEKAGGSIVPVGLGVEGVRIE